MAYHTDCALPHAACAWAPALLSISPLSVMQTIDYFWPSHPKAFKFTGMATLCHHEGLARIQRGFPEASAPLHINSRVPAIIMCVTTSDTRHALRLDRRTCWRASSCVATQTAVLRDTEAGRQTQVGISPRLREVRNAGLPLRLFVILMGLREGWNTGCTRTLLSMSLGPTARIHRQSWPRT